MGGIRGVLVRDAAIYSTDHVCRASMAAWRAVVHRVLSALARRAVSEFLLESLTVTSQDEYDDEKGVERSALKLRRHLDKISFVLARVSFDDLELLREGIHVVFGILKTLWDADRAGSSVGTWNLLFQRWR